VLATVVLLAGCHGRSACDAPPGRPAIAASVGLTRGAETIRAMALLGLRHADDAAASDVLLLGYPNLRLAEVAAATASVTDDVAGLHHTYAAGTRGTSCEGDLRFRLDGRHADLTGHALAADLDAVVALVRPTDVYTHAVFDGHPDHAEVFRQVAAALARSRLTGTLHAMLIHPEGTASCMGPSAERWPNPPLAGDDPLRRFTPALDVTAPPLPPCGGPPAGASWGPQGAPDELVEVPATMQELDAERNLKWLVIAAYASQVDCRRTPGGTYHPSCGYMRAFVKRHEFFWTSRFGTGAPSVGGPVLVVAAHPDDEALGAAGIIARGRAAGRRVVVAVVTNGDAVP
jgi:LmbE family N-acetylglucosaminyl deacetylase